MDDDNDDGQPIVGKVIGGIVGAAASLTLVAASIAFCRNQNSNNMEVKTAQYAYGQQKRRISV